MRKPSLPLLGWLLTLAMGAFLVLASFPDKRILAAAVAGTFVALGTLSLWGSLHGSRPLQAAAILIMLGGAALGKDGFFFIPGGLLLAVPALLGPSVRSKSLLLATGMAGLVFGSSMASALVPSLSMSCSEPLAGPDGTAPAPTCRGERMMLQGWFVLAIAGLFGGSILAFLAGLGERTLLGIGSMLGYSVSVVANPMSTVGLLSLTCCVVVLIAVMKTRMLTGRPITWLGLNTG